MNGWYDIASLDRIGEGQDVEGLLESARYLDGLIAKEVEAGVPSTSVLVGGFSQGAATALLALRGGAELAGIAALSGYLPLHSHPPGVVSEANRGTPVFMAHGDSDQVVAFKYGSESAAWLKEAGVAVDFRTYMGMGELRRVTWGWLHSIWGSRHLGRRALPGPGSQGRRAACLQGGGIYVEAFTSLPLSVQGTKLEGMSSRTSRPSWWNA